MSQESDTTRRMAGSPSYTTPATLIEVYRKAADLLDQNGWTRGQNVGANNERCLAAAVNQSAGQVYSNPSTDLFLTLARWLVENRPDQIEQALDGVGYRPEDPQWKNTFAMRFGPGQGGVSAIRLVQRWNDASVKVSPAAEVLGLPRSTPARTRDAVTAVLRQVAAELVDASGAGSA